MEFKVGDEVEIAYHGGLSTHPFNGLTAIVERISSTGGILILDRRDWHIRYPHIVEFSYSWHNIWDHSVKLVSNHSDIPEPLDNDLI